MIHNRRSFIGALSSLTLVGLFSETDSRAAGSRRSSRPFHIASNEYSWITFYKRTGRDWKADLDTSFADLAKSGIKGYEPSIKDLKELTELEPLLKKYNIEMPSIYVGCTLHKEKEAKESHALVMSLAQTAKRMGVKLIVTNPSPIRWGSDDAKSDEELRFQAKSLNNLGSELRKIGITLAFHNHDKELSNSAREFHHMMVGTDPKNVGLCLEAHWLFRGTGNSQVALFDILKLYGRRIVEVHLRQSINGIWTETFSEGDIDYVRLERELSRLNIHPHLVLEQCVEKQSSNSLDAVTAHQNDLKYATQLFGRS